MGVKERVVFSKEEEEDGQGFAKKKVGNSWCTALILSRG